MAESNFRRRLLSQDYNTSTVDTSVYLTFVALENDMTVTFSNELQYFISSNKDWVTLPANTESPSIKAGQTISFKANIVPVTGNGVGRFTVSKKFEAIGDPRSLSCGDVMEEIIHGYLGISAYQFYRLFYDCKKLIKVSKNFLPSTRLANYCYYQMFLNCTSLTTVPELPATTLAENCYNSMFGNCTSLTTAPELPATELAYCCYCDMFAFCTSLTTAPELPATTLYDECYVSMFDGCTSLTTAPELPATTLYAGCYSEMFLNCTSLTTAPTILPADFVPYSCYAGMFEGCTSLTTAPELPATELADYCCYSMFEGCTSLTQAPELPATKLAERCYAEMFRNCTSLTTAPTLPATTLAVSCYYLMFFGCTKLNYIKMLATDISASYCLSGWVSGVSSTGTFVKHPYMTSLPTGDSGIPSGWTVINEGTGSTDITWDVQSGTWTEEPNGSAINGVQYVCESPGSDGSTVIRCTISGQSGALFVIRSQGESSYDYLNAGELDSPCTRDSYKTSLKGNQETDVEVSYGFGDYGTHYVEFCYSKDSSVDTPPDNGVVYLKELL